LGELTFSSQNEDKLMNKEQLIHHKRQTALCHTISIHHSKRGAAKMME